MNTFVIDIQIEATENYHGALRVHIEIQEAQDLFRSPTDAISVAKLSNFRTNYCVEL